MVVFLHNTVSIGVQQCTQIVDLCLKISSDIGFLNFLSAVKPLENLGGRSNIKVFPNGFFPPGKRLV